MATTCARCGEHTLGSSMSWINEDTLCFACGDDEQVAPGYAAARAAEHAAVQASNYRFAGVGLTPGDVLFLAERLLAQLADPVLAAGRQPRGVAIPPIVRRALACPSRTPAERDRLLTLAASARDAALRQALILEVLPTVPVDEAGGAPVHRPGAPPRRAR